MHHNTDLYDESEEIGEKPSLIKSVSSIERKFLNVCLGMKGLEVNYCLIRQTLGFGATNVRDLLAWDAHERLTLYYNGPLIVCRFYVNVILI